MRRYCWGRKVCRPRPKKTTCTFWLVFHWYLWINDFVWARALCVTKISCCVSVDCNGAIGEIHVKKIGLDQALVTWWICKIPARKPLGLAEWTLHKTNFSADAQDVKVHMALTKWFKSNIIQAHENMSVSGRLTIHTMWLVFVRIFRDAPIRLGSRRVWF